MKRKENDIWMIYSYMETDAAADIFGWVCYFSAEKRRGV